MMQKYNKETVVLLDIMVQMAKLYLHLGSIEKCMYYSREAIKFATFSAFQSEEQ
jgi:hypothetical protein